jgi:hypothetical protein
VHAWQNSIIAGLHTGISNGRTEGYNRIVSTSAGSPLASAIRTTRSGGYATPAPEIPGVNQQREALLTLKSRFPGPDLVGSHTHHRGVAQQQPVHLDGGSHFGEAQDEQPALGRK